MSLSRDDVPYRVSDLMGKRPVRWATAESTVGDYDGRERTLEVFLADAADQRELLRVIRPNRDHLQEAASGPIVIIFHTCAETRRLYPEMSSPLGVIHDDLSRRFPFVDLRIRDPSHSGRLALEIGVGGRHYVVSWSDAHAFGVSVRDTAEANESPDLCMASLQKTVHAVRSLVRRAAPVDIHLTDPTQPPLSREAA